MRDPQTVPAATFDHFDFFFSWVGYSILFFFPHWFGLQFWFIYIYIYILVSVSLGTENKTKKNKKKKLHWLTSMGPQIVWKILSDRNWVMMPNGCKKLSDEWWKLSDQNWVMSDGNWVIKIEWSKKWTQTALSSYLFNIPTFTDPKRPAGYPIQSLKTLKAQHQH